jgi:hypothetical protein
MQGLPGRRGLALLIEAWSCRLSPAVKETEPPVVGLPGNVLALEKRKNITFEDRRILPPSDPVPHGRTLSISCSTVVFHTEPERSWRTAKPDQARTKNYLIIKKL